MPEPLFTPGDHERIKLGVHAVLVACGGACLLYNTIRWLDDRHPRSLVSAVVYGVLMIWECVEVDRHLGRDRNIKTSV